MAQVLRTAKTEGLTDGPILPALFHLSWPIVFSNLLQTAYNVADTFWLGRLGDYAVAAIMVSFPIIFLFISLGAGLTIAGTALVAQYIGAERRSQANYFASQVVGFVGALSVLLSILGYFLSARIVAMLGPEPEVYAEAVVYLRTWFLGIPFIFGFFMFQALIKGYGDTISPMKIMVAVVLLNIVLDPFLIFGWGFFPEMGVQGAAVATVVTRGLASVVSMILLFNGSMGLKVSLRDLKPDPATIKTILRIGLPAAAENSMKALGITAMTGIVAYFGTPTLAAFGVGNRLSSVVFLPSLGLAQATTTMVGQNLGAKKESRAERTAYLSSGMAFGVLALFGVFTRVFSQPIASIFLPGEQEALALASQYISVVAFSYGFLGVLNVSNGAFRGAGKTLTAMVFAVLSLVGLRVPLAFILSRYTALGVEGLWWSVGIGNMLGGALAFWWFTLGRWKQRIVDEQDTVSARTRAVAPSRTGESGESGEEEAAAPRVDS